MRPRILVVDDDHNFCVLMQEALSDEGYEALIPDDLSLHGVIDAVQRDTPDLLVLDLWLTRPSSGAAIVESLRCCPASRALPIIICSADTLALRDHRDSFMRQGCALVEKPFDLDAFLSLIQVTLTGQPRTHSHSPQGIPAAAPLRSCFTA